jgi:hypothetical protein
MRFVAILIFSLSCHAAILGPFNGGARAVASGANAVTITATNANDTLVATIAVSVVTALSSISGCGTWTEAIASGGNRGAWIYYAQHVSAGCTSVTVTPASGASAVVITEWFGINSVGTVFDGASGSKGSGTGPVTPSVTASRSGTAIIGMIGALQTANSGPTGGFSAMSAAQISGTIVNLSAYVLPGVSGTVYATGWTLGTTSTYGASIVEFLPAVCTLAAGVGSGPC